MGEVRVCLRGGPEHGREISVAADTSGVPVPRVTLPVASHGAATASGPNAPVLVYERQRCRSAGPRGEAPGQDRWEFHYVGVETD